MSPCILIDVERLVTPRPANRRAAAALLEKAATFSAQAFVAMGHCAITKKFTAHRGWTAVVQRVSGGGVLLGELAAKRVALAIHQRAFDLEEAVRALEEAQGDRAVMQQLAFCRWERWGVFDHVQKQFGESPRHLLQQQEP